MSNPDIDSLRRAVQQQKELFSIFDRIRLGNADGKLNNLHKPRKLSYTNIIGGEGELSYDDLSEDLKKIENLNPQALSNSLFFLNQKYGWRVGDPDQPGEKSAAVAFCDSYRIRKVLESHEDFILLKGDLAGIQKYIYGNIQPKRAGGLVNIAKKLRGRSIIVTLLTDFLANVLLRELGLPFWHLLFAGGGHFNLLIPNTEETQGLIKVLVQDLDAQMRLHFSDNLQLVIAQKVVSKSDLENAGQCFADINLLLEREKFQKHRKYLADHFHPLAIDKMQDEDWEEVDEEAIGKEFPKLNYLIETFSSTRIRPRDAIELLSLKLRGGKQVHSLFAARHLTEAERLFDASGNGLISAHIFSLNDTNFLPDPEDWDYRKKDIAFGFRFLGKFVPFHESEDRPKTFEEIVKGDENKMLAALRLDVDDLGFIFSYGMPGAALSEIVCLSREMQYFFSAHFDYLASKDAHNAYLIYSGGDDAFAVGKWDNIIQFTRSLREDFQAFVSNNPDVHFSAGIFMGNPHYPVGRFYRDAGDFQTQAKELTKNEWRNRKNRISIFNHVMQWDAFVSKIELGEVFFGALDERGNGAAKFNSAFAYRILNLVKSSYHEYSGKDKNGNPIHRSNINMDRFARNIARLRYLFARHGYDKKRAEEKVGELEKALLRDFLGSFDFGDEEKLHSLRDYVVALNYAIFLKRGKSDSAK